MKLQLAMPFHLGGQAVAYVATQPLVLHYELYPMAHNEFAGRVPLPESGLMRQMLEEERVEST